MGTLGYRPCIYDSFYPCSYGCSDRGCRYWCPDEEEEEDEENTEEDDNE